MRKKNIPLAIITTDERGNKITHMMDFVKRHGISHVYANMEYEVDELRRDIKFAKCMQEAGLSFEVLHDQTVVEPGTLRTGAGGPHKVFTPYHKAWLVETKANSSLYDVVPPPESNAKDAVQKLQDLFDSKIPNLPDSKQFASDEESDRIRSLWPPGHDAGMERLREFLHKKVSLCIYRPRSFRVLHFTDS